MGLAVLPLVLTACGNDDDGGTDATSTTQEASGTDVPVATVGAIETTADDGTRTYAFEVPDGLTAGPVQLSLVNGGEELHHAQVFEIGADKTFDDVTAALAESEAALFGVGTFVGGTGPTSPFGGESTADSIPTLGEGSYVMLCFLPDAEGVPHLANGMVTPFDVGPAAGDAAEIPEADATITMVDFDFEVDTIPAEGTVTVVNEADEQIHEAGFIRLEEGATQADVEALLAGEAAEGPPPFAAVGGMQAVMPGASQALDLDLEPGEYVLVCAIPDPADGVSHVEKGMIRTITIE